MAKGFKEIQYSIYAEEEGDGQGAWTWSHGREVEVILTVLSFIHKHQSIRRLMVLAQHRISHRRPWFALACLHLDRNSVHCSRHLQPECGSQGEGRGARDTTNSQTVILVMALNWCHILLMLWVFFFGEQVTNLWNCHDERVLCPHSPPRRSHLSGI